MRISAKRKIGAAHVSALLVLLVGLLAVLSVSSLETTTRWVDHTAAVLREADGIVFGLTEAETSQRAFLITGDSAYVRQFEATVARIKPGLARLRTLTSDNARQQVRVDSLSAAADRKLAVMQQSLRLKGAGAWTPAAALTQTQRGTQAMGEARAIGAAIDGEEQALLASRTSARDRTNRRALAVILIGSTLAFAIALVVNLAIRADFLREERLRAELEMNARVLDSMSEGVSVSNEKGIIVYTNPAEDRIFGYTRGELVGKHVGIQNAYPPEENERMVASALEALQDTGSWSGLWRNIRKDGTEFTTHARITVTRMDGQPFWVCVQEDVTEAELAEQRSRFLERASVLLGNTLDSRETLAALTRHCVPFLADYCSIDMVKAGEIVRVHSTHRDPAKEQLLHEVWTRYPYRMSDRVGVPEALRTRQPMLVRRFEADAVAAFVRDETHLSMLRELAPRSLICVPLVARGHVYGAISVVMSDSHREYSDADLALTIELAARAGTAIDNATLFEAERRARERISFLSDASALLASSMDYEVTLRRTAELAVPQLSDWCAVDLITEPETLTRVAITHHDPSRIRIAHELQEKYPPDPNETRYGIWKVLRTGEAEFYPVLNDEMIASSARDETHLALLREIGFTSVMLVPLAARGRTLGVMTFVTGKGRTHDESDYTLAQELARRAAIFVDNARLMQETEEARITAVSANRAKSDFLATMSHEIRTPINAILGYSELLELGLFGALNEAQRQQLARVGASTRHLLALVNEVLDLAKIEAGTLTVQRDRLSPATSAASALSLVRPQAASKGIAVSDECSIGTETDFIGDEHRVRQVLANLVANAVKFTDPGGRIDVRCRRANPPHALADSQHEWVAFEVIDTGIGIAQENLAKIFEPFTQAESGYTRERNGAGLGLSISRRLARLMDGEITVESRVSEGSRFTLWLPAAAETGADGRSAGSEDRVAYVEHAELQQSNAGLAAAGQHIVDAVDTLVAAWVRELRAHLYDRTRMLTDAQIEDHAATLLTDIGLALRVMEEANADAAELIRDGHEILRVVSERHGAQRYRLGWVAADIDVEMDLLGDLMFKFMRTTQAEFLTREVRERGIVVLAQLLDNARRTSLRAHRLTSETAVT